MATSENKQAWSKTAATNASSDSAINAAEGCDPGVINNDIRSMMASEKKWMEDIGGGLSAGGSANALTVTTNEILSAGHVTDGLRLLLKATADNTSATVTFAPDGLTARNIKRADGSALAVGSIKNGMYLDLVYNNGASEWRAANIPPAAASAPSTTASFSAYKSASQAVATTAYTKVSFNTENFDVGGFYDAATNFRWTPPAGTVFLHAAVSTVNLAANTPTAVKILKNGSTIVKELNGNFDGSGSIPELTLSISAIDQSNGTDYYEIWFATSDSSYSISHIATGFDSGACTYFMGHMI